MTFTNIMFEANSKIFEVELTNLFGTNLSHSLVWISYVETFILFYYYFF